MPELLGRAHLMARAAQAADVAVIVRAAESERLDVVRYGGCCRDALGQAVPAKRLVHEPPLALLYCSPAAETLDPLLARSRAIMRRAARHWACSPPGADADVMQRGSNRLAAASMMNVVMLVMMSSFGLQAYALEECEKDERSIAYLRRTLPPQDDGWRNEASTWGDETITGSVMQSHGCYEMFVDTGGSCVASG